ncbi:TonB-dependent receptor [Sphingobacteriales bacterium UPWRP_1]|nr:TonB-dependent receptor [Sphingobacteriales bacterium UPWRP_1]
MKYFLNLALFMAIFLGQTALFAQTTTGDVRGFVYDKETGEPIIFTNVYMEGTGYGASTDVNGFYSINKVPAGDYVLLCTYVGYDTTRINIQIKAGEIANQKIFLDKTDIVLKEVEISTKKQEAQSEVRTSTIKITPKQISIIPAIGGEPDLAQYLQILPGVIFTGDQGGQLYIRGGSEIQTKVLLDGMTIYNPFHSVGLFSVFETDIIKNVEVNTGGFNASYGGRISAVIDVTTRDGNKKRHSGKVSANTFLAKALLEGPITKLRPDGTGVSGSYIVTAKNSYLNRTAPLMYDYVNEQGLPYSFTDVYGKMSFTVDNGSKFSLQGYRFGDDATFRETSDFSWSAWGMGSNFVIVPGQSKIILDGFFSFSTYDMKLLEGNLKPRTSSIGGFNTGVNFSYFLPKGDIKYGIEMAGFATTFDFYNPLGIKINQDQNTTELSAFVRYKAEVGKLLLEPSVRTQFYASLSAFTLEPRIGLKYNLAENLRLKASAGIYTQNFISTKSDQDVVNLFTGFLSAPEGTLKDFEGKPVNNNLQRATHAIGGVEINLGKHAELNVEGYYKKFNQLININRNKLFATDPDYIIETGNSYGMDLLLKYDYKRLYLWTVYSLSWVNRNDGNQEYPPHFDRRHNTNFLASYKLGKDMSWEVSARWNLGSGFPFTQTQGFYESIDFSGGIDADYLSQNGTLGVIYDEKLNGGRLPSYHRLDVSIRKEWKVGKYSAIEANASLTNVYNRANIFYFDRIRYERVDQLPILPSIGLAFSF